MVQSLAPHLQEWIDTMQMFPSSIQATIRADFSKTLDLENYAAQDRPMLGNALRPARETFTQALINIDQLADGPLQALANPQVRVPRDIGRSVSDVMDVPT